MPQMLNRIVSGWALFAGLLTLVIVLITTANAASFVADKLARLMGGNIAGLAGYEDFVRLLISAIALMFLPYCQLQKGHVAVDLFVEKMSRRTQAVFEILSLALTAGVALFLALWMIDGMFSAYADFASSPILGWPNWPFYIPGILSLFLWAAVAVMQIFTARKSKGFGL